VINNRESAIQEVHQANATMQRNKERFAAARASSGAAASAMIAEQKMVSVGIICIFIAANLHNISCRQRIE